MVVNKEAMTQMWRTQGTGEGKLVGENWSSDNPGAVQRVTLTFAEGVEAIQRLSRLTGQVEEILLTDHKFTFELPGGTGDLFKYRSSRAFAGNKD